MADKSPSARLLQPESPTTAREPDFDDTPDVSELSIHPRGGSSTPTIEPASGLGARVDDDDDHHDHYNEKNDSSTATPHKPDPSAQLFTGLSKSEALALTTLIDAFPDIEARMIKAVLRAGEFQTENAFEALLEYSDPTYVVEDAAPPPPPPRPSGPSQLETDEYLARRLEAEFNRSATSRRSNDYERTPDLPRRRQQHSDEDEERESNFFEDELPKIGKQIHQGFIETQSKFNKMLSEFKKKMDGDESDEDEDRPGREYEARNGQSSNTRDSFDTKQSAYGQIYGNGNGASTNQSRPRAGGNGGTAGSGVNQFGFGSARSNSLYRDPTYDADPRVLDPDELYGDSFRGTAAGSALKTPGAPSRVKSPNVKFADLPGSGGPGSGRGTPRGTSPIGGVSNAAAGLATAAAGGKKWQPLNNQTAQADKERDRDPFELGDSDEEDGPAVGSHVLSPTTPTTTANAAAAAAALAAGGKIHMDDDDDFVEVKK